MVTVPERLGPVLFAPTLKRAAPDPVPDAPDAKLMNPESDLADHPQSDLDAPTFTWNSPPPAAMETLVGETVYEHPEGGCCGPVPPGVLTVISFDAGPTPAAF